MASTFDTLFQAPVREREDVFQSSLVQLGVPSDLVRLDANIGGMGGILDASLFIETDGPLSARLTGRWIQAFAIGFARYAASEGYRDPKLEIVDIGTSSFWVTLRKINDVIALPGFLLGIYALLSQHNGVDEATLRRILDEQRPLASATAALFEKDRACSLEFSISGAPLGTISRDQIKNFRAFERNPHGQGKEPPYDRMVLDIPTWRNVVRNPEPPEWEGPLQIDDLSVSEPPLIPVYRDGWVFGTHIRVDRDQYGRFEGMEGVLIPLRGADSLLRILKNRAQYRFAGEFIVRNDGLRTGFVVHEAVPL